MKKSGWPTTSRQSRGYGSTWDVLRLDILRRDNGLCQCAECKADGLVTLATEVHHIKSKAECARLRWTQAQTDHPSNLAAINRKCHQRETMRERGATPIERPTIGLDGFPV